MQRLVYAAPESRGPQGFLGSLLRLHSADVVLLVLRWCCCWCCCWAAAAAPPMCSLQPVASRLQSTCTVAVYRYCCSDKMKESKGARAHECGGARRGSCHWSSKRRLGRARGHGRRGGLRDQVLPAIEGGGRDSHGLGAGALQRHIPPGGAEWNCDKWVSSRLESLVQQCSPEQGTHSPLPCPNALHPKKGKTAVGLT